MSITKEQVIEAPQTLVNRRAKQAPPKRQRGSQPSSNSKPVEPPPLKQLFPTLTQNDSDDYQIKNLEKTMSAIKQMVHYDSAKDLHSSLNGPS